MKLIVCIIVIMTLSEKANGGGKGSSHDVLKIHVPEIIKHEHHTRYVFIHKHEPKKATTQHVTPKIKGHLHKHFFGFHGSHGHHEKPTYKIRTSHKTPHLPKEMHKPKIHGLHPAVHKPHVIAHMPSVGGHHHAFPMTAHHQPFTHDDAISYSQGHVGTGYQVTENQDPESEVHSDFNINAYSVPGDLSSPPAADHSFFSYPSTPNIGAYGPSQQGLSSYDISPYYQTHQTPQQDHGGNLLGDQPSYNPSAEVATEDAGYDFDYSPPSENDFKFEHNGFDDASNFGHESDEFGENVPGYTQHHKEFLKDIHQNLHTAYDESIDNHFDGKAYDDIEGNSHGYQHGFHEGV